MNNSKKKQERINVIEKGYDTDEQEKQYQRTRQAMAGPKKKINLADMEAIHVNEDKFDASQAQRQLDAKKQEFMGG